MSEQPCAPALRRLWAEGGAGRRNWALTAYDRFCNDLSPWTRDSLPAARDETTIVLFGPTQVGKTTLLLDLLGVAAAWLPHVADVLRGGREAGRSATATPMVYNDSLDDFWRLDYGGREQKLDDDGLKQALAQIRELVEAGRADTRPAILHIPARYFNAARRDIPRVRILDLPGLNPANANESEHVRRVVEEYVPTADLVLLITRADHLGFLQPESLTAGGLRALDWTVSPARFCIVTSFAFKLGTLQSWLSASGETRDVAALRARLAAQMRTFGMKVDAARLLYPLDFGKSWADTPPDRRALVEPLMAELRRDLQARIAESAQPLGRLRHANDAYRVAVQVQQTELERHTIAQEASARELKSRADRLENCRRQFERRLERLRSLPSAATTDQACKDLKGEVNKILNDLPKPIFDKKITKKSLLGAERLFRQRVTDCISNLETLESAYDEEFEILKLVMAKFDKTKFAADLAMLFKEFAKKIDGYFLGGIFSNLEKDKDILVAAIDNACRYANSRLNSDCDIAAGTRKATLADKSKRDRYALRRVAARIERLEDEQRAIEADIEKRAAETATIEQVLDEDKKRATQFNALLRAALLDDLRVRREALANETIPTLRFLQLLEAVSVCDRAHSLLESSPTT